MEHRTLQGVDLHQPFHFIQEGDPGAQGAFLFWLKMSTGEIKRRNATNTDWIPVLQSVASLPPGGTTGQVATKASNVDGDVVWSSPSSGLPIGGTTGQVLAKASNVDGDALWATIAAGGGADITKTNWINLPLNGSAVDGSSPTDFPPQYRQIGDLVFLRGRITAPGHTTSSVLATLPVGFRPARRFVVVGSGGSSTINKYFINADGTIVCFSGDTSGSLWLDGIKFSLAGISGSPTGWGSAPGSSPTIVKIGEVILAANAANITFAAIPNTFKSLRLIGSLKTSRTTDSFDNCMISFNGDVTAANYAQTLIFGGVNATPVAGNNSSSRTMTSVSTSHVNCPATMISGFEFTLLNPFSSTFHKNWICQNSVWRTPTIFYRFDWQGRWANTAAINSIALTPETGPNWIAGSEVFLYGIN